MNHTSGIMRYEFKDAFTKDLSNNPDKVWKPEELIAYVLDENPVFKAGEGWEYSDTNYIVLAIIIEQVTGKKYYDLVTERILRPLHLTQTLPSNKRKLKGLVQGYAGKDNPFGGRSEVIAEDGEFIINPQFEWTGGGIYSSSLDLAKCLFYLLWRRVSPQKCQEPMPVMDWVLSSGYRKNMAPCTGIAGFSRDI